MRNGAWSADGATIVFQLGLTLFHINALGGQSERLRDAVANQPHFLPSEAGRGSFVYTTNVPSGRALMAARLSGGAEKVLDLAGSQAVFAPTGHLVFASEVTDGLHRP